MMDLKENMFKIFWVSYDVTRLYFVSFYRIEIVKNKIEEHTF